MVIILNWWMTNLSILMSFNPSVTDQSVALSFVLTKTTYSELFFDIKLSTFKYGRLFPLHSRFPSLVFSLGNLAAV